MEFAIREGRFQRLLSLIAGLSAVLSGLEVSYEHYKGGYSQRVMYTPVLLSAVMGGTGIAGVFSRRARGKMLRAVSAITLADCAAGFYFHVRGIQRKPGGWGLPITNIVMGPPIFAPLLFGTSAWLGLIASSLPREEDKVAQRPVKNLHRHMAMATSVSALLSGFEAWYSHYKNNFRYKAQWTPVILAPLLIACGAGAAGNGRTARKCLPFLSALALIDGAVGFGYHTRGIVRRPGGLKKPVYNVIYGPPIFAPLLFAACGFLGVLASLLGRERQ
jgi:hypothetical protein